MPCRLHLPYNIIPTGCSICCVQKIFRDLKTWGWRTNGIKCAFQQIRFWLFAWNFPVPTTGRLLQDMHLRTLRCDTARDRREFFLIALFHGYDEIVSKNPKTLRNTYRSRRRTRTRFARRSTKRGSTPNVDTFAHSCRKQCFHPKKITE